MSKEEKLLRFDIPCSVYDIQSAIKLPRLAETWDLVEKKLPPHLKGSDDHRAGVILTQIAA